MFGCKYFLYWMSYTVVLIQFISFQKQDKYKDTEPTAIDLFKETHCSSKIGFTESVKKAIVSPCFLVFPILNKVLVKV